MILPCLDQAPLYNQMSPHLGSYVDTTMAEHSIPLLKRIQYGDDAAAGALFERYFDQLDCS